MSWQRAVLLWGAVIVALFALFLIPYVAYVNLWFAEVPLEERLSANRQDPTSTISAFTYALIHNRLDVALPLLSEDGQSLIEGWTTQHEPLSVDCHDPIDPDLGWSYGGSSGAESFVHASFRTHYECGTALYTIYVMGRLLQKPRMAGRSPVGNRSAERCEARGGVLKDRRTARHRLANRIRA